MRRLYRILTHIQQYGHISPQFREKPVEFITKFIIRLFKGEVGMLHVGVEACPSRETREGLPYAGQGGVTRKPVLALHVGKHVNRTVREQLDVLPEKGVTAGGEGIQFQMMIGLPVAGQEMVVKHIHNNRCVFTEIGTQPFFAFFNHRMGIGEGIDHPVETYSLQDVALK